MKRNAWRSPAFCALVVGAGAVLLGPLGCGASDASIQGAADAAQGLSETDAALEGGPDGSAVSEAGTQNDAAQERVPVDASFATDGDSGPSEGGSDASDSDSCVDVCGFENPCPDSKLCCMPLPGLPGCSYCASGCPG